MEDISPEPGVPCATTVPAIEYVAPAPVIEHVEPAPVIECIAPVPAVPNSLPSQSLPSAHTMDITGMASPRCSTSEPQIADLGFDMFGKLCEMIRIGTEPRCSGQIRVLYTWKKRGPGRVGLLDATRCQAQEAFL